MTTSETWYDRILGGQDATQYLIDFKEPHEDKIMYDPGVYHSVGGVRISLSRRPMHFALNVFLPTGTLVLVSLIR